MIVSRRLAGFLLSVSVWMVYSWSTFARNLAGDEGRPPSFYVAHGALIVVNLVIAAVLGRVGWRAWRAAAPHRDTNARPDPRVTAGR